MENKNSNKSESQATTAVSREKSRIRRQVLAVRGGLDVETRQEFSRRIVNNFLRLGLHDGAQVIHTYLSFGTEAGTNELLPALFAAGKRVVTSVLVPDSEDLLHAEITPDTLFLAGKFGVPAPLGATPKGIENFEFTSGDVVIVPVVAFDLRHNRLGYGKGYYDRFLAKTDALRVGFAFSCQEVPLIPPEPHDIPLHLIVTETGTFG